MYYPSLQAEASKQQEQQEQQQQQPQQRQQSNKTRELGCPVHGFHAYDDSCPMNLGCLLWRRLERTELAIGQRSMTCSGVSICNTRSTRSSSSSSRQQQQQQQQQEPLPVHRQSLTRSARHKHGCSCQNTRLTLQAGGTTNISQYSHMS